MLAPLRTYERPIRKSLSKEIIIIIIIIKIIIIIIIIIIIKKNLSCVLTNSRNNVIEMPRSTIQI